MVPDTCEFSFYIKVPSEDSETNTNLMLIYFLVSLAVVLVLTWLIVSIIRYRQRTRVQNEFQLNQQQSSQQQRRSQQNFLTILQLDQYMKKILWREKKLILNNLSLILFVQLNMIKIQFAEQHLVFMFFILIVYNDGWQKET